MVHVVPDFLPGEVGRLERVDVDFGAGVAHIADNAAVLHGDHVLAGDDALVARARDHLTEKSVGSKMAVYFYFLQDTAMCKNFAFL